MDEKKTYRIGEHAFYQTKLGLYQATYVMQLIDEQKVGQQVDPGKFIQLLGDRLTDFLGVVLIPQGMSRKEFGKAHREHGLPQDRKDLFLFEADLDLPVEVVEDFFSSSQIPSLYSRCVSLVVRILQPLRSLGNGSSPDSASPLGTETPVNAMTSAP